MNELRPLVTPAEVAVDLPVPHQRAFLRLAKELQVYGGRWGLFVLLYEHSRERELVAEAIGRISARPSRVLADNVLHPDWMALETSIAQAAEGMSLVQVFGLEQWLNPHSDGFADIRMRALNVRREAFSRAVPVPVLLWLRPSQVRQLATVAPDLWSWRGGVHRFLDEVGADESQARLAPRLDPGVAGIDNRSGEQRRSRIEELRRYLERTVGDEDASSLRGSLNAELASLHESLGEADEALRIRTEDVLPFAQRVGDERLRAQTLGRIADLLHARGQLDVAMRIRTDEELPAYERLGDLRAKAAVMGRIADVMRDRGQFDEAIRIHTEDELPVYESFGDVRSKAATLAKIAAILEARGELDEALRICTEEVLPVFERLGDVHAKVITLGKIASILQARGQSDEALRIYTEEVLPASEHLGDVRLSALTWNMIAGILQARGQLDEALRIRTDEELPVYERLGDVGSKSIALCQIADIFRLRGKASRSASAGVGQWDQSDTRQAITYYERALVISHKVPDRRWELYVLISLGDAWLSIGETGRAVESWERALEISRSIGDRDGEGAALSNLGGAFAAVGETHKAIEHFEKALVVLSIGGPHRNQVEAAMARLRSGA